MPSPKTKKRTKPPTTSDEFHFDKAEADRAEKFFPAFLRHVKGEWAGQPIELMPWMRDQIIRPMFGWKRRDGTRRYKQVYIEVPRKNAKSTLCAGVGSYLLFCDKEPGAEVYSAAADRDQAAIVFNDAKTMIEASPELAKRCKVYKKSVFVPRTVSAWSVLSADVKTKHGKNSHGIIFDEFHAQPNRDLYDVLHTSTGARRQSLEVLITTAGYDRNSICWELHDYAIKVRDGTIKDDSFLPVIYAAGEDDDWKIEETWKKANPSYGISIKPEYLAAECKRAQESPAYENTFKRLHLNIWTEQASRWMPMDTWNICGGTVDENALQKRKCFGGLDLASRDDIAALVLVFPPETDDEIYQVLCRFWIPEENMRKRVRRDRVPYDLWVKQGLICATEGNSIDYDVIRGDINALGDRFAFQEIAFDPWNATQLATQLTGDGFTMVEFRQGFQSMTEPTKQLMALCLAKKINHGDNAVLRWMASNVAVKQDPAGNLKPDKGKSTEKIDGIVALIMALGRAIVQPNTTSVYEERGIVTL
jgi:phage terminase large subunit-like protein